MLTFCEGDSEKRLTPARHVLNNSRANAVFFQLLETDTLVKTHEETVWPFEPSFTLWPL